MMSKIIVASLVAWFLSFFMTGCAEQTLQITKCNKQQNGVCVVKEIETVKLCKKPIRINGKIYCKDK